MKKFLLDWFVAAAALAGMIGCAQIKKPPAQARAMPTGLHFDQVGRVTLYAGEPCTPADHVRFSWCRIDGLAGGADVGDENPGGRGK